MTKAPNIKEALEDCVSFIRGDIAGSAQREGILREAEAALAAFQPSGERREAIIRSAINGIYGLGRGDFAGGFQNKSIDKAIEKILASGFVRNETKGK